MTQINRRELLQAAAGSLAAATVLPRRAAAAQNVDDRFFAEFTTSRVKTSGAEIHVVKGGRGAPLLLLHGAPQSHITWRLVAPLLMNEYTLVIPDLRGYGDSSKPADTPDHASYSKRNMALDLVEVMKHFGFSRFPQGHCQPMSPDRLSGPKRACRATAARDTLFVAGLAGQGFDPVKLPSLPLV